MAGEWGMLTVRGDDQGGRRSGRISYFHGPLLGTIVAV